MHSQTHTHTHITQVMASRKLFSAMLPVSGTTEATGVVYNTDIVAVQSCFNGLAIYSGQSFFDASCSYGNDTAVPQLYVPSSFGHWRQKVPCEHVSLNLCLAARPVGLRAGVVNKMHTVWHRTGVKV